MNHSRWSSLLSLVYSKQETDFHCRSNDWLSLRLPSLSTFSAFQNRWRITAVAGRSGITLLQGPIRAVQLNDEKLSLRMPDGPLESQLVGVIEDVALQTLPRARDHACWPGRSTVLSFEGASGGQPEGASAGSGRMAPWWA